MELMEKAGLPKPEIEEASGAVTLRFHQEVLHLTPRRKEILALLANHPHGLSRGELLQNLPKHLAVDFALRDDLQALKSLDLAITTGHGRGAKWFQTPIEPN